MERSLINILYSMSRANRDNYDKLTRSLVNIFYPVDRKLIKISDNLIKCLVNILYSMSTKIKKYLITWQDNYWSIYFVLYAESLIKITDNLTIR